MRIVFLGTPQFAIPSLRALIDSNQDIVAVVTQMDKPQGRGHKLLPPPVKVLAKEHNIEVLQFERIRNAECVQTLRQLKPDLMVTVAYGQILSQEILDIATHGVINVHGSLLPKYRGSAPVHWAIMNGEKRTGITIMQTAVGVDDGDMILSREIEIFEDETTDKLLLRLADLGAECLLLAIEQIKNGTVKRTPQDHAQATHFPMLKKTDGEINFGLSAEQIKNQIRAINPAYTYLDNQILKIWKAQAIEDFEGVRFENAYDGEVVVCDRKLGIVIKCGQGLLKILELQPENKKRMEVSAYLNGASLRLGTILCSQL